MTLLLFLVPSSDIEIASDLDTVYVGGNATFTCTINASAAIDTPIRADVTWYSGSIASQFNSSNDNVTIKTVPESNLYHVSTLTIGAVSRVAIQAGVGCAAVLYPADGQPPEIEPSAVEQTDISVTILGRQTDVFYITLNMAYLQFYCTSRS